MINKLKLRSTLLGATVLLSLLFSNCRKDQNEVPPTKNHENIENFDKMVKFLTVIYHLEEKELIFDDEKSVFIIPKASFSISLEEVQDLYNNANEYKLKYE